MADNWRLIDTGLRSAAQNIALNRALLESRHAEEIPSTLRFLRYTASALLGVRHSAEQEFDIDGCRARGIAVQRRISGGAACYADERQLGWELYLHARDVGPDGAPALSRRLCHAAAAAISALGVDARHRAGSEIEVDGKRIAAAGLVSDGNAVLFQGLLLIDADFETAARVLRLPASRPYETARAMIDARETTLRALLGRMPEAGVVKRNLAEAYESEFGVEFAEGDLTLSEHARYQAALRAIDAPAWIQLHARPASEMPLLEAAESHPGGLLRATVMLDMMTQTIRQVWFYGDITARPPGLIPDLEAALRDVPMSRLARKVEWFFRSRPTDIAGLGPDDFVAVVRRAVGRPLLARNP